MTEAYETHDARFIQYVQMGSPANGLILTSGAVPAGKVWTIIEACIAPSVAETQDYWFAVNVSNNYFPVTVPREFTPDPATLKYFPMLNEGMELRLYPGEKLAALRDAATAGSTFSCYFRFIETDLPYYKYVEPLKRVVQSTRKHGAVYRSTGGISESGAPSGGHGDTGGGGDDGNPPPV